MRSLPALILFFLVILSLLVYFTASGVPWYWSAIVLLALLTFIGVQQYNRLAANPKWIALVSTMSAISAASRAVIHPFPDVQPATFFVIMSGYALGPAAGGAVGALTALVSNLFLGEGGWTPWQMFAWAVVGIAAGVFGRIVRKRTWPLLITFGFLAALVFGWIMDLWSLFVGSTTGTSPWRAYLVLIISSFRFDLAHAVTTAALLLVLGRPVAAMLLRYKKRMEVTKL